METSVNFLGFYLAVITAGFVLIPKEPAMFGMGLIPGPFALFSGFGFPIIASIGIGFVVFGKSVVRKGINTVFFLFNSIIIWLIAFILFY
jgi:hypothetical protein